MCLYQFLPNHTASHGSEVPARTPGPSISVTVISQSVQVFCLNICDIAHDVDTTSTDTRNENNENDTHVQNKDRIGVADLPSTNHL